jgi:hypothetical protein
LPPTIEGVLRDLPPRRPNVVLEVVVDAAASRAKKDYPRALLSCAPSDIDPALSGEGELLRRNGDDWQIEARWRYDPPPPHARWSQVLAPAPLCLPTRPRG